MAGIESGVCNAKVKKKNTVKKEKKMFPKCLLFLSVSVLPFI